MKYFNFGVLFSDFPGGLNPSERIAAENSIVAEAFPKAVARAGWRCLKVGDDPAPVAGEHVIVVGVVKYSKADLLALEHLAQRRLPKTTVLLVLDMDLCGNETELLKLVPGISPPMRTPVVAEYSKGMLLMALEGQPAASWCEGS